MTVSEVAQAPVTKASRGLSNTIFGRHHQLEVAAAAAGLEAGFEIEDLTTAVKERAAAAGVDPPKQSAVRTNLKRLVSGGAVSTLTPSRPGSPGYYSAAQESPFWPFAAALYARV